MKIEIISYDGPALEIDDVSDLERLLNEDNLTQHWNKRQTDKNMSSQDAQKAYIADRYLKKQAP